MGRPRAAPPDRPAGRRRGALLRSRRRAARLYAVRRQPSDRRARGPRRPARRRARPRSAYRDPDPGRRPAGAPRRCDRRSPAGCPGGLCRLQRRRGRHAARRHLPERRDAHPAHRPADVRDRLAAREVRLSESADDSQLLSLVERGELELSFSVFPVPAGPYACVELLRDPYMLLVSRESPLATRRQPLSLRDMPDLPLIGPRMCKSGEQLEDRMRSVGIDPHIVFRSDDNPTVQGLVSSGVGAAILPGWRSTSTTSAPSPCRSTATSPRASSAWPGTAIATVPPRPARSSTRPSRSVRAAGRARRPGAHPRLGYVNVT